MITRALLARAYHAAERLFPSHLSNFDFNRRLWDRYARRWSMTFATAEVEPAAADGTEASIEILGDEWGTPQDVSEVLDDFVFPFITSESVVLEIGVGGGRIARAVAPHVSELHCIDISGEMLRRARMTLAPFDNVQFYLLRSSRLPETLAHRIDFVYAFDVFVHLDLHMQWAYFGEIARVLTDNGKALVHTTNLCAPNGWRRFAGQSKYSVHGHYFVVPQIVDVLAARAGLTMVKRSDWQETANFYYARDFLAVLERTRT